jgi:DNA ligase D-like protein (predicted 3'-phosphoesterase)
MVIRAACVVRIGKGGPGGRPFCWGRLLRMSATQAMRALVRGTVQGVGFRDATVRRARALGVLGWVRNGDDGEVLVHAEGPPEALASLEAFLGEGPRGARVEEVAVERVRVEGHEQFAIRGVPAGRFAVAQDPFVLHLEVDGRMRSWAVPKGPSMDPADKRLALELPPSDARAPDFDASSVWDRGLYEQGGRVPWPEALDRGHAVFVLHGDRLRGGFALQRTRGPGGSSGQPQWLLVKRRDEHAEDCT